MEKAVIIALDFKDFEETRQFIEQFDESLYVKSSNTLRSKVT